MDAKLGLPNSDKSLDQPPPYQASPSAPPGAPPSAPRTLAITRSSDHHAATFSAQGQPVYSAAVHVPRRGLLASSHSGPDVALYAAGGGSGHAPGAELGTAQVGRRDVELRVGGATATLDTPSRLRPRDRSMAVPVQGGRLVLAWSRGRLSRCFDITDQATGMLVAKYDVGHWGAGEALQACVPLSPALEVWLALAVAAVGEQERRRRRAAGSAAAIGAAA